MRSFPPYELPSVNISSVSGDSLPRSWSALREMGVTYRTDALPNSTIAHSPFGNLADLSPKQ
jgi:hypothetical protein